MKTLLARTPFRLLAWLIGGAVLSAASASAHHSHQNYIRANYTHLEGTITEVHWLNPHSWVYLEVRDADGRPTVWALEGAAFTTLLREGWTREMVEVGDEISVRCHPLKDGSPGCLLGSSPWLTASKRNSTESGRQECAYRNF